MENKLCARPASLFRPEPRPRLHRHMFKYQHKRSASVLPQRASQKVAGPGVPKCRIRFFRHVAQRIAGIDKYVIRRGKEPVEKTSMAKPWGTRWTYCTQRSVATPTINTRRDQCQTSKAQSRSLLLQSKGRAQRHTTSPHPSCAAAAHSSTTRANSS